LKLAYSTGNAIVDEVSQMNITGNIIPAEWFHTICNEEGKPMLLAITILSDILYWYRPKEIRDEETGNLIEYRKRFKADFLQRSYRQIERQFGVSKKQARTALEFLCNIGVIKKHLRDEVTKDGMILHNTMFLELIPEKLKELTYPQLDDAGVPLRVPPSVKKVRGVVTDMAYGDNAKVNTNTYNTTNNTTINYNNHINTDDAMEVINTYEEIIKENIEYEYLIQDNHGLDKENIDEIVNIIVEIVAIERKHVFIGGEKYPYQLVKKKLLMLDSEHIRYVMHCMKNNTTKVKNIRSYLLTALYNAPNTIDHYYQAEVKHDLYGC